jgi:hypothetical protein
MEHAARPWGIRPRAMAKRSISMLEQTRHGDPIMDSEVREVPSRFVDFRTFLKEQVPL